MVQNIQDYGNNMENNNKMMINTDKNKKPLISPVRNPFKNQIEMFNGNNTGIGLGNNIGGGNVNRNFPKYNSNSNYNTNPTNLTNYQTQS